MNSHKQDKASTKVEAHNDMSDVIRVGIGCFFPAGTKVWRASDRATKNPYKTVLRLLKKLSAAKNLSIEEYLAQYISAQIEEHTGKIISAKTARGKAKKCLHQLRKESSNDGG